MQTRPSFTLVLDVDSRLDSREMRLEVTRCYSYVGSTVVRTHEGDPAREAENIARVMVKLGTRRYLHSKDEGADELWSGTLERWLYNVLHKVGNNMVIYNRRQREIGNDELVFPWIEIELQNGELPVRLHLDSNCSINPECVQLITQMREHLNAGDLGENVCRVSMPAPDSYAQQAARYEAEKAEREERIRAEEEAARIAEAQARAEAEAEAAESFLESPELTEQLSQLETAAESPAAEEGSLVRDDALASPESSVEDIKARYDIPDPDFEIDYGLWLIEYHDGTARNFDASAKTLSQVQSESSGAQAREELDAEALR